MAFDKTGWRAIGGEGKAFDKGKIFSYTSNVDTLATMKVADYFAGVSDQLDAEYFVVAKGTDGVELMSLTRDATVIGLDYDTRIQSLSGPGAADIITKTTMVTTTGADAVTLANATALGQVKVICLIVDGGTMILTPATGLGYTTITFADAGDSVTLMWLTGGWAIIGQGGLATGPVSA